MDIEERDRIWELYIKGKAGDASTINGTADPIALSKGPMPSELLVYEPFGNTLDKNNGLFYKESVSERTHKTISELDEKDALGDFLSDAVNKDCIELPDVLARGTAKCTESMSFSGANFLVFRSRKGLFFVCQLRRAVDAIILPTEGLVVGRNLESVRKVCCDFVDQLYMQLDIQTVRRDNDSLYKFRGLLVNQPLPYHYFYDVLPGFYWLYENLADQLEKVFFAGYKNGYFLPVSQFFEIGQGDILINELNEKGLIHKPIGFYLACLRNDRYNRSNLINKLDKFVSDSVRLKALEFIDPKILYSKSVVDKSIVWFGILAGKRYWKEQEETIVEIINQIGKNSEGLFFVFDGLTSTEFNVGRVSSSIHAEIIERIVVKCGLKYEEYISLNGARAVDKLYWASKAKIFLSDAATSSVYVSRFFGVPGICHAQPKSRVIGHIHKNADFVPAEYVVDLTPEKSWIYSPYSISPEVIVPMFVEKFASIQELADEY